MRRLALLVLPVLVLLLLLPMAAMGSPNATQSFDRSLDRL